MPWVGFEPTITAFERAKTVHALGHGATVIGKSHNNGEQSCKGNIARVKEGDTEVLDTE
jgi:hypothetical protein